MEEILRMIETVSPDDTAMLDEIDIRTHCYLRRREWGGWHKEGSTATGSWMLREGVRVPSSYVNHSDFERLSRSRDALKAIRPEGWKFLIHVWEHGGEVCCGLSTPDDKNWSSLPTEELAELHAILQAIEYERTKI